MSMDEWTAFPYDATPYQRDPATLRRLWPRLHAGDVEPLPADRATFAAWALYHAGEFRRAVDAGLELAAAGMPAGVRVANRAQAVYATYLEPRDVVKQALFLEVAQRAGQRADDDPTDAGAWYGIGYALGRYGQSISVARALAEGLGMRVKSALETTIRIAPLHAEAHLALGTFHAEIIDKIGALLGRTQGASKDAGLAFYKSALRLNPTSAITMIEYARGMVMLEGEKRLDEATSLYRAASACVPLDAAERLEVEMAKAELED